MLQPNDRILFQGDSVTDTGREREVAGANAGPAMGRGYALFASAHLLAEQPGAGYQFLNRGISGNNVTELAARWQVDCLDLAPDVLSVLIGVNDSGHAELAASERHVPHDAYEATYRRIIAAARQANPALRLVLCEPFAIKAGPVTDGWIADVRRRGEIVRKLAAELDAVFVPFQQVFDEALELAGPEHWMPDGFHPTVAGHMRMARCWLEHVGVAVGEGIATNEHE